MCLIRFPDCTPKNKALFLCRVFRNLPKSTFPINQVKKYVVGLLIRISMTNFVLFTKWSSLGLQFSIAKHTFIVSDQVLFYMDLLHFAKQKALMFKIYGKAFWKVVHGLYFFLFSLFFNYLEFIQTKLTELHVFWNLTSIFALCL